MTIYEILWWRSLSFKYWTDDDLWTFYKENIEKHRPWPIDETRDRIIRQFVHTALVQRMCGFVLKEADPVDAIRHAVTEHEQSTAVVKRLRQQLLESTFDVLDMDLDTYKEIVQSDSEDVMILRFEYVEAKTTWRGPVYRHLADFAAKYSGTTRKVLGEKYLATGRTAGELWARLFIQPDYESMTR